MAAIATEQLRDGRTIPRLGLGTWNMGDAAEKRAEELAALRTGIENGVALIDTAEMYGSGRSESLVGEAISFYDRERLFLVSKVLPEHAGKRDMEAALDASLKRLRTDYLDIYLYHWRGPVPLEETVEELNRMVEKGKILSWGVSNFDTDDMEELYRTPGGDACVVNQDLYHLGARGIEYDLLPWMRARDLPLMAYCPLAQGGTLRNSLLQTEAVLDVAEKHGAGPLAILLAFVLRDAGTIAIPKSGKADHVLANIAASEIILDEEDRKLLDQAFPPPTHKVPLECV